MFLPNNSEFDFFDHIFDQQEKAQDLQVKRSLQAVIKKDPNMVAEGLYLANELGIDRNIAYDSDLAVKLVKQKKELKSGNRFKRN